MNGGKVWQARVSLNGRRRSVIRGTQAEARDAESEIRRALRAESERAEQESARPATLRQLLEFYELDMKARGRGDESASRADYTRRSIEDARALAPAGGGAARARHDGLAVPGDRQAGRAHADASEIRFLRWADVHLEQGVILLPRAKAGARPVILSGAARSLLVGQREHSTGELVFPGPGARPWSREQIGKVFRKAARAAGQRRRVHLEGEDPSRSTATRDAPGTTAFSSSGRFGAKSA